MLKHSLDKIVDDAQLLVNRLRAREDTVDVLRQQVSKVQAQLLSMKQYQEESLSFDEFSKRISNHPKGQLILCLTAENKQLEQLRIENKTLRNSLDEHRAVLDMIMTKYRGQVAKLMHSSMIEQLIQSIVAPNLTEDPDDSTAQPATLNSGSISETLAPSLPTNPKSNPASQTSSQSKTPQPTDSSNILTTEKIAALAAIVQDVSDQGDAYATELEEEIHRLRTENAGLRELLSISSACSLDNVPTDPANPVPSSFMQDNCNSASYEPIYVEGLPNNTKPLLMRSSDNLDSSPQYRHRSVGLVRDFPDFGRYQNDDDEDQDRDIDFGDSSEDLLGQTVRGDSSGDETEIQSSRDSSEHYDVSF